MSTPTGAPIIRSACRIAGPSPRRSRRALSGYASDSWVHAGLYPNPLLLASVVALDDVSKRRVVLGLGGGDLEEEFRAIGMSFPPGRDRQAALGEVLQIIPCLLRGEAVAHSGTCFKLDEAKLPSPAAEQPYVPVLVGGGGERVTLRLVDEYADASNLVPADWGGGATTSDDTRRKICGARRALCRRSGGPSRAILRTFEFVPVLLADTPAALEAKARNVPPWLLAFAGPAALIGRLITGSKACERCGGGPQYFVLSMLEVDTLRLFAERIMPVLMPSSTTSTTRAA